MLMLTIASEWCFHRWCWADIICWPHGGTRVLMIHPLWSMNVRMCLASFVSINEISQGGGSVWGSSSFFSFFVHLDTYFDISQKEASFGVYPLETMPVQTFITIHSPDTKKSQSHDSMREKKHQTDHLSLSSRDHDCLNKISLSSKKFCNSNNWWSRGQFEESVALNVAQKCPPCLAVLQA